jgi:hypothetical protein
LLFFFCRIYSPRENCGTVPSQRTRRYDLMYFPTFFSKPLSDRLHNTDSAFSAGCNVSAPRWQRYFHPRITLRPPPASLPQDAPKSTHPVNCLPLPRKLLEPRAPLHPILLWPSATPVVPRAECRYPSRASCS